MNQITSWKGAEMITVIASSGTKAELKIGQSKPDIKNRIISFTISGEELGAIKKLFPNLVMPAHKEEVVYKNDMAQFLWDNM